MRRSVVLLPGLLAAAFLLPALAQDTGARQALTSGLEKDAMLPAFNPKHVTGPDRGSAACPV
jgi:hypothetical protein